MDQTGPITIVWAIAAVVTVCLGPSIIFKLTRLPLDRETIRGILAEGAIKKTATTGLILLFLWQAKESLGDLGLASENLGQGLLIGLPAGVGILIVNALLSNVLLPRVLPSRWRGEGEPTFLKEHLKTPLRLLMLIGFSWWAAGFVEELERAFLITRIGSLFGTAVALIVTSVFFGARHWYQGKASAAISTSVSGFLFGTVWLMAGRNLITAIVAHATLDSLALILLYLMWRRESVSA